MSTALMILVTIGAGLVSASFYEWAVHKYLLHRPRQFLNMKKWFEYHTRIHHVKFGYGESYHLQHDDDKEIIDMRKWAPVVVSGASLPYVIVACLLYVFLDFDRSWIIVVVGVILSSAYYFAYEYLHWCMHLPKERRLEMSSWFRRLNGHHLIHHRQMGKNYNVVLPLADWIMGTLLLRATVKFKQPGAPVPDVQPLG